MDSNENKKQENGNAEEPKMQQHAKQLMQMCDDYLQQCDDVELPHDEKQQAVTKPKRCRLSIFFQRFIKNMY